jgi:hypothetical protein
LVKNKELNKQINRLLDLHVLHAVKCWIECSNIYEASYTSDDGSVWPKHVVNIYENRTKCCCNQQATKVLHLQDFVIHIKFRGVRLFYSCNVWSQLHTDLNLDSSLISEFWNGNCYCLIMGVLDRRCEKPRNSTFSVNFILSCIRILEQELTLYITNIIPILIFLVSYWFQWAGVLLCFDYALYNGVSCGTVPKNALESIRILRCRRPTPFLWYLYD